MKVRANYEIKNFDSGPCTWNNNYRFIFHGGGNDV